MMESLDMRPSVRYREDAPWGTLVSEESVIGRGGINMKKAFVFVLAFGFVLAHDALRTSIARGLHGAQARYVWAPSGLNLREKPSPSARVIATLPYGTGVVVVPDAAKPVPYRFEYFSARRGDEGGDGSAEKRAAVRISGHWVKVDAKGKTGYVVDALLLDVKPKDPKWEVADYLIHVFGMKKVSEKKSTGTCEGGITHTVESRYESKDKKIVLVTVNKTGEHPCWTIRGEISMTGLSFAKAFVFFNAVLPLFPNYGYTYIEGKKFEYPHDGAGNEATLKKTKDGVSFEWVVAPN